MIYLYLLYPILMFPTGYEKLSPFENDQSDAIVSGPSLPIYIRQIHSSFVELPISGVIPVDRPEVPKALTTSKIISISAIPGSKMQKR